MAIVEPSVLSEISMDKNREELSEHFSVDRKDDSSSLVQLQSDAQEKENCLKRKKKTIINHSDSVSPSKIPHLSEEIKNQNKVENETKHNSGEEISESQLIINTVEKEIVQSAGSSKNQMEERTRNSSEYGISKDNFKSDKDKIRRRRSSFGRYNLSKQKSLSTSPQKFNTSNSNSTENVGVTPGTAGPSDNPAATLNSVGKKVPGNDFMNKPNEQESHSEKKNVLHSKIEIYQERSKQLENEYRAWKRLLKKRKQRVFEAKRELCEAEKGDTVIEEEDVLPHLSKECKMILLTRPNYGQYLQEMKRAKECFTFTHQEVERVSLIYQSSLKLSEFASQTCYGLVEEKILGSLKGKDPKTLLKAFMECHVDGEIR